MIVGDILHSRVARSNVWLLTSLGAEVELVAPPTLVPVDTSGWPARVGYDLDASLAEAPDVVMMLRIQAERMHAAFFPEQSRVRPHLGTRRRPVRPAAPTTMVMQPGPMNRGLEIAARAADSPQSTVREQVANGVSVRMAALYLLLSGERGDA